MFKRLLTLLIVGLGTMCSAQSLPVMGPISGPAVLCSSPASVQSFTASASNLPLAYGWTVTPSQGVVISNQGGAVTGISFPATGSVSVYVIACVAINAGGAAAVPATYTITVFETPQVTFSGGSAFFCQGSSTNIQASPTTISASSTISYSWTPAAGLSATNVPAPLASPSVTTTYTVNYAIGSCTNTSQITFSIAPLPVVMAVFSSNPVCLGQTAVLNISGTAANYFLNNNPTNASAGINTGTLAPGTFPFVVSGTDLNGCSNSTMVNLTVDPVPVFNAAIALPAICPNQTNTITLTGNATSYSVNGLSSGTTAVVSAGNPQVIVSGMNALGCTSSQTVSFQVYQAPWLNVTLSNTLICMTQSAVLNISGSALSYSLNGASTPVQVVLSGLAAGVYNYSVSGTNNEGCTNSAPLLGLTVSLCNGIDAENNDRRSILVAPNPASADNVVIHSEMAQTAVITDLQGRIVLIVQLQAGDNKLQPHLSAGVYVLRTERTNLKLVIKE